MHALHRSELAKTLLDNIRMDEAIWADEPGFLARMLERWRSWRNARRVERLRSRENAILTWIRLHPEAYFPEWDE